MKGASKPGGSRTKTAARLTRLQLGDHLVLHSAAVRRVVLALRKVVLAAAPDACEAVKFRAICYYRCDAGFGAIGGNICMIEARPLGVRLSFIHGAALKDPHALLKGEARSKRYVPVASVADAQDRRLVRLIGEAVRFRADV